MRGKERSKRFIAFGISARSLAMKRNSPAGFIKPRVGFKVISRRHLSLSIGLQAASLHDSWRYDTC